jgi:hypothetical protein
MPARNLPEPLPSEPYSLDLINRMAAMLASAQSLDEITNVRNIAEMARNYAKAAQLGLDAQNHAAEIKLRAERQAGAFLAEHLPKGGDRRSKRHDGALKLEDLGINRQQARRWREQAEVPEPDFEKYLTAKRQLGEEVTSRGLRQVAQALKLKAQRRRKSSPLSLLAAAPLRQEHRWTELVVELAEHREQMEKMLTPVCRGPNDLLKPAEQRHLQNLLLEMATILKKLAALKI